MTKIGISLLDRIKERQQILKTATTKRYTFLICTKLLYQKHLTVRAWY